MVEKEFYGDGQHNGGVYFWGNLNPYIYTYQNPIVYVDPNGKQSYFMTPPGHKEVGKEGGSLLADLTPLLGDVKGIYEGIRGRDILGNKLNIGERLISILLLSEIKAGKNIGRTLKMVKPLWGAKIADYGTTAMEHIKKGHFFDSRKGQKTSRFSESLSNIKSIKELVQEAVSNGKHTGGEDNYKITYTFKDVIGTTDKGKKTKTILIYMDKSGNVKNAYPIPKPMK